MSVSSVSRLGRRGKGRRGSRPVQVSEEGEGVVTWFRRRQSTIGRSNRSKKLEGPEYETPVPFSILLKTKGLDNSLRLYQTRGVHQSLWDLS